MDRNRQWRVKRYVEPDEIVGPEHFDLVDADIPEIRDNEFLVRSLFTGGNTGIRLTQVSLDPWISGRGAPNWV